MVFQETLVFTKLVKDLMSDDHYSGCKTISLSILMLAM